MDDHLVPRRRDYAPSLASADWFIVRGLRDFLLPALGAVTARGARVADVGCGEQPLRARVEAAGAVYTGIDVVQNAARSVDVVAPADRIPCPDASFDVVLCTEVLEHVPDADAAFRELVRIARPGGHVVLTVPFCYRLHEEPYDFRRCTPHQVAAWAEAAGADVVRVEALGDEAAVLATVFACAFEDAAKPRAAVLRVPWNLVRRVPVVLGNCAAAVVRAVLIRALPRRTFLGVGAVLRRREGGPRSGGPGADAR